MTRPEMIPLTHHARSRMDSRRVPQHAVEAVLAFGRTAWVRGAQIFAVGKREVAHGSRLGMDLRPFQGLQVICSLDGTVLTVYRNHDFRSLRRSA